MYMTAQNDAQTRQSGRAASALSRGHAEGVMRPDDGAPVGSVDTAAMLKGRCSLAFNKLSISSERREVWSVECNITSTQSLAS